MNKNEAIEIDPLRLLRALWRKAVAIILAAVIFGAGALAFTAMFVTPLYKAEALMYVNSSNISLGGTKVSISQSELAAAQTLVDTYIVIMNTRTTMEAVIAQSGVPYTYEEMMEKEMVHAAAVNGTEVFRIEVTSPDPEEAELLANTIAQILPSKISSIVEGSSVRIVDYAVVPSEKDSPSLLMNGLIGAALGFALACSVVLVQELTDKQIHDSSYLLETYDIPVLAVIPDIMSHKHTNEYYQRRQ